jgi:type IX secretion system PorP/SprF family membrane protein
MKRVLFTVFFLALMLFILPARAQQDVQFSMYMLNPLYYNPAFAGVEGLTKLTVMHRNQWMNYGTTFDGSGGAPISQVVSLTTPILRMRSGVGVHLVNDQLGPLQNIEAKVAYAYHLAIDDSKLSFGLSAGIYSQSINKSFYRWNDPSDYLNLNMEESQIRPDMAAGVFYRAPKYFAGLSFSHLNKSEFDFAADILRNALENHTYFTAGYDYEYNYDLTITVSTLVKTVNFKSTSVELSAIGNYKDRFWGGLSFRQAEAAVALLGYSLLKDNSLRFGYAFDYVIKAAEAKAPTSHEFLLSYALPVASGDGKKPVRTPRFRHQ